MAYSDYTFSKLEENFGIRQESSFLFVITPIEPIIVSARLLEDLDFSKIRRSNRVCGYESVLFGAIAVINGDFSTYC
jgi:hypothetical protein